MGEQTNCDLTHYVKKEANHVGPTLEARLYAHTTKKDTHPCHFGPNGKNFCHAYDTSIMIIVTKPGIIIDVVGSYFYDKKS